jgi:hypothetical protein
LLSRREFLASAAAGVALAGWESSASAASPSWRTDFSAAGAGPGWPGFACVGVANLLRNGTEGVLEAGSDVFPNDPRPVAFAVDRRFAKGSISAVVTRTGAGAGVVLRRTSHRHYYAAIYDQERASLVIVRRNGDEIHELAATLAAPRLPFTLTLAATGSSPSRLAASLVDADGRSASAAASDGHSLLQGRGDPGVLATARTLFPSERNEALPALGNIHLLPYGVQEGQAVLETPAGQQVIGAIRERSTAAFREISVTTAEALALTTPSVVAATTGLPRKRGTALHVASDLPARVSLEIASRPDFRHARHVAAGVTGDFEALTAASPELETGRRYYWRPRVSRRGRESVGPTRSFGTLPPALSGSATSIAVAACASQFGPIFDQLARRRPDVLVWQGDLNYPDTHGPLAQTVSGYAGIWRDFLANPRMRPILDRASFVVRRDDHDYGVQDANSGNLKPLGLAPWEALMDGADYQRFTAGLAEVWSLDQRRFKTPPGAPDTQAKTLLGRRQRAWLLDTLAASRAPFKVICSPCTLSPSQGQNGRDGNWSSGYKAERDLLLRHIASRVSGTTIFITGDTHYTMVYDRGGVFEARPCPLDIPAPNDITLSDPMAAQKLRERPGIAYADDRHGHFAQLEVSGEGSRARLDLTLVRDDGVAAYTRRFEERIPSSGGTPHGKRRPRRRPGAGAPGLPRTSGSAGRGGGGLPFTGGNPVGVAVVGAVIATAGVLARRVTAR